MNARLVVPSSVRLGYNVKVPVSFLNFSIELNHIIKDVNVIQGISFIWWTWWRPSSPTPITTVWSPNPCSMRGSLHSNKGKTRIWTSRKASQSWLMYQSRMYHAPAIRFLQHSLAIRGDCCWSLSVLRVRQATPAQATSMEAIRRQLSRAVSALWRPSGCRPFHWGDRICRHSSRTT